MKLARKKPVQHEKFEQQNIVQLARTIGGPDCVWVLGTRRSKGKNCPRCGTFVAEHQGTRQTPGHPDLVMFLPHHPPMTLSIEQDPNAKRLLYWETKRDGGGRVSAEQDLFRQLTTAARVEHGIGDFDDFIAWCVQAGYCRADQFPPYRVSGLTAAGGNR